VTDAQAHADDQRGWPRPLGYRPPAYPQDRLDEIRAEAASMGGEALDLSIGTPIDPPPPAVVTALATSGAERGYPAAIGSAAMRTAASRWMHRRFGVEVPPSDIVATVGSKELVVGLPRMLWLADQRRDVVLYPELAYPSYEMGAELAGLEAIAVPLRADGSLDLASLSEDVAQRALLLWLNWPANPHGAIGRFAEPVAWARQRGIVVASDECYAEFTWQGPAMSVLAEGPDGVLAVHSLSKRSNLAGVRAGFIAGDHELVGYLGALRRHAGLMVPGPVQAAAAVALDDDAHVEQQRARYRERIDEGTSALSAAGLEIEPPRGGFYLWVAGGEALPGADGWEVASALARSAGVVAAPGELYGASEAARRHVRIALVAPTERLRSAWAALEERPLSTPAGLPSGGLDGKMPAPGTSADPGGGRSEEEVR